jgi:murein DD-endopeptidase MepM/ murein hydrolase activator NlpD
MLGNVVGSNLLISFDSLKLGIVSFCITIAALYMMKMHDKIADYVNIDAFLFEKSNTLKSDKNYNDLFSTLENDIEISDEPVDTYNDEEHSHSDEGDDMQKNYQRFDTVFTPNDNGNNVEKIMIDEHALNHNRHVVVSLNSFNKKVTNNNREDPVQKINNLIDQDHSLKIDADTNAALESDVFANTHHYILPIADAFEKSDTEVEKDNRKILKRDIANLYEKRKEMTLAIRKIQTALNTDIANLKATFRVLGMPISQKIAHLKTDIRAAKILKKFKLTDEELGWRYPELSLGLQEIYRLRILASFLPTNDPVVNARRSSHFGYRRDPFTHRAKMHAGLDFAAKTGTPLLATGVGVIKFAGFKSGYGNSIDVYHGNGIVTRYGHLSRIFVKKGQRVSTGQKIGAVGSTGRSTGAHLHYEVRVNNKPMNPVIFLNKKNFINNIFNKY